MILNWIIINWKMINRMMISWWTKTVVWKYWLRFSRSKRLVQVFEFFGKLSRNCCPKSSSNPLNFISFHHHSQTRTLLRSVNWQTRYLRDDKRSHWAHYVLKIYTNSRLAKKKWWERPTLTFSFVNSFNLNHMCFVGTDIRTQL